MPLKNADGSLYWATGIDNTGLIAGKAKSVGIIRGLMRQVSGFDVFAGLSASAIIATAKVNKELREMSEQFEQSMKEVQTISAAVQGDYEGYAEAIVALSTELPQSANELAKAYYQIVSAGYDGQRGLELLTSSARGAIGGVTDVTTAADGMTTVLNAWKISAEESSRVADVFFNTVKLGKTTFGELSGSISQVAALASSMGISFEEVMAAIATLTKQGAPTANAITQIRQAIIALSENLGDGWSNAYTFQEGLVKLRDAAGGSDQKLKDMVGRIEGVNGVLGLTGDNARVAAEDLNSYAEAAGSADAAFTTMLESSINQGNLLKNNIDAALKPIGDFMAGKSTDFAKFMNEAFESGKIDKWAGQLSKAMVMLASFTVGMKSLTIAQRTYNTSVITGSKAVKALFTALSKNPVGIVIGTLTALGVALYQSGEKARESRKEFEEYFKNVETQSREMDGLFSVLTNAKKGTDEHKSAINRINAEYGDYLPNLITEKNTLEDIKKAHDAAKEAMISRIAETTKSTAIDNAASSAISKQAEAAAEIYSKLKDSVGSEAAKLASEGIVELGRKFNDLNQEYNNLLKSGENAAAKKVYNEIQSMVRDFTNTFTGGEEYNLVWNLAEQIAVEEGNLNAKKEEIEAKYSAFIKKIEGPKIEPTVTDEGSGGGSGGDGSTLAYYEQLTQQIEQAEESLKLLAGKQGEMDLEAIQAQKEKLAGLQQELALLDELLGLSTKKVEVSAPDGSIRALEEEISQLEEQYENASTAALRKSLKTAIEAKEKELELMEGVQQEKITLEEDYYEKIQTMGYDWLKEEMDRLKQVLNQKKVNFNTAKNLSTEEKKQLKSDIEEVEDKISSVSNLIENKLQGSVNAVSQAFKSMSSIIGEINSEVGEVISGVADMASGISSIAMSSGNPADIVSGMVEVFNGLYQSISSLGTNVDAYSDKIEQMNEQWEEQIELIEEAARKGGMNEAYEDGLDILKNQREELEGTISDLEKKQDRAKFWGLWNRWEKIQEEIDKVKAKMKDLDLDIEDFNQDYTDFLSGFITEIDIADKIAEAFEDGKTSVKDFADYAEDIMKSAILEVFKAQILGKAITNAQEFLAFAFEDGEFSEQDAEHFTKLFNQASLEAQAQWEAYTKAFPDFFSGDISDSNSLSGSISASLTEETGSILAGRINSILLDTKKLVNYSFQQIGYLQFIELNTRWNRKLNDISEDISTIKNNLTE